MPGITITNNKIRTIVSGEAEWARFQGFSLLFDNPGNSLSMMGCGLNQITCPLGEPGLEFYTTMVQALNNIRATVAAAGGSLLTNYRLCLLPSRSYHVTVWDGMNNDNFESVRDRRERADLDAFLASLPESFITSNPLANLAANAPLVQMPCRISFRFSRLRKWNNKVLVALLESADPCSRNTLRQIKEARSALYADLFDNFGVGDKLRFRVSESFADALDNGTVPETLRDLFKEEKLGLRGEVTVTSRETGEKWEIEDSEHRYVASKEDGNIIICRQKKYNPHVTLGYFANKTLPPSRTTITNWSNLTAAAVGNLTITFESISLYGFTDMATFFKD